jgi:hypothetical protein
MIEQLRELADAEPFAPFTICTADGLEVRVTKKKDFEFTRYGSPKIRLGGHWAVLNVNLITRIIL